MFGFGKKDNDVTTDAVAENLFVDPTKNEEEKIEKVEPSEEWVWINGFKGTEKDMTCRGYQFEMNRCFDISEDKPVELCEHGFHFCLKLEDVYCYYNIGRGHRYFEVKALVRKKDAEQYGIHAHGDYRIQRIDKLAAKSIIFTRELTADEILNDPCFNDWSEDDKKCALEHNIAIAETKRQTRLLVELGYSETFARMIAGCGKFDIAYSVGTQEGLSMDMKVWCVFSANYEKPRYRHR